MLTDQFQVINIHQHTSPAQGAHPSPELKAQIVYTRIISILVKAYVTYVRPLLEYAVHVWSPHQLEDIARIESVQRRFTKRLSGLSNDNYSSRLETLGLKSLELRRLHQLSLIHI